MSAQAAIASTALLLLDLQNDFLHPDGAYGRAGQTAPEIAALPARLRPLLDLPVEMVLVSHGEPVLRGGRTAIERALS